MELRQYLRTLRAHRLFAVASLVLCVAAAAGLAWTRTPVYDAHTQLFVSTSNVSTDPSATYQAGLFSEERVLSYAQIVSSPAVLDAVRKQLGLSESIPQLQAKIQVGVPTNTVLLNVTAEGRSARRAQALAQAIAGQFINFVDRLETPPSGGQSPVKVSVTSQAQLPTGASSPRKLEYLALGIIAGLVLGIGGAVFREATDRRIRSEDEAAETAGAVVLGSVAERASRKARPPVVVAQPSSARAEAYRRLRANLGALVDDRGVGSFVISSAVAGEGKTVVAANLGVVFAQAGYRVVLVDANLRVPRLGTVFGLASSLGLVNVLLNEDLPLTSVLQTWSKSLPLEILGTGPDPPNPSELLASQRFAMLVQELTRRYDIVIIDAPPLLGSTDATVMARVTSGAIVVARPGSTQTKDLADAVEGLRAVNATTLGVVANRPVRGRRVADRSRLFNRGPSTFSPLPGDLIPVPLRNSNSVDV